MEMNENMNSTMEQKAAAALEKLKAEEAAKNDQNLGAAPVTPNETQVPTVPDPTGSGITTVHVSGAAMTDEYREQPLVPKAPEGAVTAADIVSSHKSDDDEEVIIGGGKSDEKVSSIRTDEDETVILTSLAKDQMKNVPDDIRSSFISDLMPELKDYKKELIVKHGMTPDEADEAVKARLTKKAADKAFAYGQEHPDAVIVTIDKSQEEQLKIDNETARKMQVAKAIKLVIVENAELESLPLKPSDKKISMNQMRDISGSLSHYSIPLLSYGDYATFIGAQTGMLANAITDETDDMLDILEKKAGILYQCFERGTIASRFKTNDKGKEELKSYEDFCNWYHYDDIDMGIYAVVVASAMEESDSTYVCQNRNCGQVFPIHYNSKELLDLSAIPEMYKDRVNEIDAVRSNSATMQTLHDQYNKNIRLKSPISNNIYDIGNPTIADVHQKFEAVMRKVTSSNAVDLVLLIYMEKFYIYDSTSQDYAEIVVADDPAYAFDMLCTLTQVDVDILTKYIGEHKYSPSFKIKTKCPHCGREATDQLSLDNMLFIHARASVAEIQ